MTNYLFGVSYLGTNYAGWQKQENALAIQEVIENAMKNLGIKNAEIFASGRTDAGVHALEQCFNATLDVKNIQNMAKALNSKLPKDIRILWVKEVDKEFHARFSAHKKTYIYRLKTAKIESPFDYEYTAYIDDRFSLDKMIEASKVLIGEHNFQAFCSAHTTTPDFVRTIYSINITRNENLFQFEICGNGFLYNMVRIIVGTLLDVGKGKITKEQLQYILESKNRQNAGKTMEARGLVLKKVEY